MDIKKIKNVIPHPSKDHSGHLHVSESKNSLSQLLSPLKSSFVSVK